MRVYTETYEYTLYIGADGIWVMHTWDPRLPDGDQWVRTTYAVSARDPFASDVTYNAWE